MSKAVSMDTLQLKLLDKLWCTSNAYNAIDNSVMAETCCFDECVIYIKQCEIWTLRYCLLCCNATQAKLIKTHKPHVILT